MARLAGTVGAGLPNPYDELRQRELERHDRRGGRLVLLKDGRMERRQRPGSLLAALIAGEPVEVEDWQVPHWARPGGGRVRNVRCRVHADGAVEEIG
ncbi:hypothetical protein [Mycolicibacterium septicum]|uniref:hypothetical protein n=1 Tax=Mycolicibacterium septicum TaxID=98668 RepID=UPI001AF29384|nr:hypothetical protein [Mycolicibacterium septicum]QRY53391.1 hypothetical protein JVX95_08760 [Mycolicibacterium septicum]